MCDGTGESAVAVFRITDGKITLWHQLPTPPSTPIDADRPRPRASTSS